MTQVPGAFSISIQSYAYVLTTNNADGKYNLIMLDLSASIKKVFQFDASINWQMLSTVDSYLLDKEARLFGT